MFICNTCLKNLYENSPTAFKSHGPCEICKSRTECNDIPMYSLIKKGYDESDSDYGYDESESEDPWTNDLSNPEVKHILNEKGIILDAPQYPVEPTPDDFKDTLLRLEKAIKTERLAKEKSVFWKFRKWLFGMKKSYNTSYNKNEPKYKKVKT